MGKANNSEEFYVVLDKNIKIIGEKIDQFDRTRAFEEMAAQRKTIYQGHEDQPMYVCLEALAKHFEGPKTDKVTACENLMRQNLKSTIEPMFKQESYVKQEYPEMAKHQVPTMPRYFALETMTSLQLLLVTVKEQHKISKDDGKAKEVGILLDKFGGPFDTFLNKSENPETINSFRQTCMSLSDQVFKQYH